MMCRLLRVFLAHVSNQYIIYMCFDGIIISATGGCIRYPSPRLACHKIVHILDLSFQLSQLLSSTLLKPTYPSTLFNEFLKDNEHF